jgi:hypothetical protein
MHTDHAMKGKEHEEMRRKELCTDQVLHSNASSGLRVEHKARVMSRRYSLEWKVLSTRVACEKGYQKGATRAKEEDAYEV